MSTSLPLPGSLPPRHPDGDHPVLRALDPRDVADQEGLVAPGVQVPPLAAARIVARARLAAVRTSQRAPSGPLQLQPKLLRLPGRLHPGDLPLRTEAQNGIQPFLPAMSASSFPSHSRDRRRGRALRAARPRNLLQVPRPERRHAAPPRSAAVPVAWVPNQVVVRGVVERTPRRVGGTPASSAPHPLTRRHTASLAKASQPAL